MNAKLVRSACQFTRKMEQMKTRIIPIRHIAPELFNSDYVLEFRNEGSSPNKINTFESEAYPPI